MSRRSDPFWRHVDEMAGGSLKCVFCGNVFAAAVAITRIKYHLAKLKGGGTRPCEKVPPHVQRAAFDNIFNGKHGSMSTWVDSMPMPDAPETGLGTEPAEQPFDMDMSNISSSLMQSVVERGSSSKRPVDRSMPGSSNNTIVTAGSDRAQQEGQLLLDRLSWKDIFMGEIFHTDENVAPVMPMPDAPETEMGTEPADQPFEMDMNNISSSLMRDVEFSIRKLSWEFTQYVAEKGSSSKRPVDRSVPSSSNNEATNAASTPVRGLATIQEEHPLLDSLIWGENLVTNAASTPVRGLAIEQPRLDGVLQVMDVLIDALLRMRREITSDQEYKHSVVERGSSSKSPVHKRRRTISHAGRVHAGAELTELPDGTWWRENLLIVSLMENRIKDIPSEC